MTKQSNTKGVLTGTALGTALFGAIVGGTAAAAKGIRQVKNNEATKEEVAVNIAKEAGTTAVAAGAAGAVVGTLGLGPFLSTLGIVAVATGAKYALDSMFAPASPAQVQTGKKHAPLILDPEMPPAKKTAAKKAAPKKTTTKKAASKKSVSKKTTTRKTAATKKTETKTAEKK